MQQIDILKKSNINFLLNLYKLKEIDRAYSKCHVIDNPNNCTLFKENAELIKLLEKHKMLKMKHNKTIFTNKGLILLFHLSQIKYIADG